MSERAVNYEKNKWANLLSGEMGKDINDVLSGKVKVKLSWKERYKYKIKRLINNFRKNKDKNAEIE
jgi:hypothetical protein